MGERPGTTVFEKDTAALIPDDEAPVPGVTEACLICENGMLPVHEGTDQA